MFFLMELAYPHIFIANFEISSKSCLKFGKTTELFVILNLLIVESFAAWKIEKFQ